MSTLKFGIEVEAYNVAQSEVARVISAAGIQCVKEGYNHQHRSHWKVVSDASVHGDKPFELVSPPLIGERGMAEVERALTALAPSEPKINTSCGLHVHVDASGWTLREFKRVLTLYAALVSMIDQLMPLSRVNNEYAKNLPNMTLGRLDSVASLHELQQLVCSRYYKLNIQSYWRHGTVEFRQHSGTTEPTKVIEWVKVCGRIMRYAASNKPISFSWTDAEKLAILTTDDGETYASAPTHVVPSTLAGIKALVHSKLGIADDRWRAYRIQLWQDANNVQCNLTTKAGWEALLSAIYAQEAPAVNTSTATPATSASIAYWTARRTELARRRRVA